MARYIIRRLLWLPVVLLAVSAVTFFLAQVVPGDPVQIMVGNRLNPAAVERLREQYGLDKPVLEQYWIFLTNVVTRFDFGESYRSRGVPVTELVLPRLWVSFQLNLGAFVISIPLAILIGVLAATNRFLDRPIVFFSLVVSSIPVYVSGFILFLIFARALQLLPPSGWDGLFSTRAIMPIIALALPGIGTLARLMRTSMLEVLGQEYLQTARGKGLSERAVLVRHALKNAMLPMVTQIGLSLAGLIGGSLFLERIFGIPGMGDLALESIFARDYPVLLALTLMVASIYVLANLLVDIIYTYLDPRIRFS